MNEYYIIDHKSNYYGRTFRFVSLYNGARGPWTSKLLAEKHGESHKQIVKKIIKGEINE